MATDLCIVLQDTIIYNYIETKSKGVPFNCVNTCRAAKEGFAKKAC